MHLGKRSRVALNVGRWELFIGASADRPPDHQGKKRHDVSMAPQQNDKRNQDDMLPLQVFCFKVVLNSSLVVGQLINTSVEVSLTKRLILIPAIKKAKMREKADGEAEVKQVPRPAKDYWQGFAMVEPL
jgi:hypothetical protein